MEISDKIKQVAFQISTNRNLNPTEIIKSNGLTVEEENQVLFLCYKNTWKLCYRNVLKSNKQYKLRLSELKSWDHSNNKIIEYQAKVSALEELITKK